MKLLFIGDIVGSPGRKAVRELVPRLRAELGLGAVVANGENSAGGSGITPKTASEIFDSGVDIITSGGKPSPPTVQRIYWATLEGVVAAVLLVGGGGSSEEDGGDNRRVNRGGDYQVNSSLTHSLTN